MAAPQQISFGIGSPADIPNFLTFGLFAISGAPSVDLDFCETTVHSLMPARRVRSLMPDRSVESLMPNRRTPESCA